MRQTEDIIQDILDWRTTYDGQTLQQHLTSEIEKLQRKTAKSKSFRDEYIERSGQLPPTMISKLEDSVLLLERMQYSDEQLNDRDKTIISDMLEFIVLPFYHFSVSANRTMSSQPLMDLVVKEAGEAGQEVQSTARITKEKLGNNLVDYPRLANLLIELCDDQHYPLAAHVRHFRESAPEPVRSYGMS